MPNAGNNMTFDPDSFDVDGEVHRYAEQLLTDYERYHWENWGDTPEAREATFWQRLELWRQYTNRRLDKARARIALNAERTEKHHYRFNPITEENWWRYTWGDDTDLIEDTPVLLLGVKHGPIVFHEACPWDPRRWSNQTGGYACLHPALHGVLVPLSDKGYRIASLIEKHWEDSQIWEGDARLDQVLEYRAQLREHNLDCNRSYQSFHEAWYPIDVEYLPLLTDINIEPTRDAVEEWIYEFIAPPGERFLGLQSFPTYHNWKLVICGVNSD